MFTEKERKIIKLLLCCPDINIGKYYGKIWRVWSNPVTVPYVHAIDFPLNRVMTSLAGKVLDKLEKQGILVSEISAKEYEVQFALGVADHHKYNFSVQGREILEKLFEDEIL